MSEDGHLPTQHKWFSVVPLPQKNGRKTRDYEIISRQGVFLGRIEYYNHWRQHVLHPAEGAVWSSGCLEGVAAFLRAIGWHRRENRE